jgi:hypothetical protein
MAVRADSTGASVIPLAPKTSQVIQFRPAACPDGIEPRVWRKALRQRVEVYLAIVTGLLSLLDDAGGDCELEDGGDYEPSLGAPDVFTINGFESDLEADDLDRGEADYIGNFGASGFADDEPNLGSPEIGAAVSLWLSTEGLGGVVAFQASQERWANGTGDDDEPDQDHEASVGVDTPEAMTTEWSEAHPHQTVPGGGQ